jgi:protein involved in polysaccharide export with SLBB domain
VKLQSNWLWVVLALGLMSCSATGYQIADLAAEINATRDAGRTLVAPGDTVRVTFPYKMDWNQTVTVRQDGYATFFLVDDVAVAGLKLADLDARLSALYAKAGVPSTDQLTVDVTPPASPSTAGAGGENMFVVGDVERPGPIVWAGRSMTLVEAISAAGGHRKATANLRNTILIRRLASGEMRSWRLDADIYRWGQQPPIYLQPRDITAIDDVDIWVDKYIRQLIPLPTLFPPTT